MVYRAEDVTGSLGQVAIKVLRSSARPVHAFELHREAQWSLQRLHPQSHPKFDARGADVFVRYLEDHTKFEDLVASRISRQSGNWQDVKERGATFDARRRMYEADDFDWKGLGSSLGDFRPYVVMELLTGDALHWFMTGRRNPAHLVSTDAPAPLSHEEHCRILMQLARACHYLDSHGLIHRDLRACNVQLLSRGSTCKVKVLDLGVAISADASFRFSSSPAVRVFDGHQKTPGYDWLPVEVRDGHMNFELPTHAFDAFSLGVLWLQLMLGREAAREVSAELKNGESLMTAMSRMRCLPGPSFSAEALVILGRLLGSSGGRPAPAETLQVLQRSSNGQTKAAAQCSSKTSKTLRREPRRVDKKAMSSLACGSIAHKIFCQGVTRDPFSKPFRSLEGAEAALQRMAAEVSTLLGALDASAAGGTAKSRRCDKGMRTRIVGLLRAVKKCHRRTALFRKAGAV